MITWEQIQHINDSIAIYNERINDLMDLQDSAPEYDDIYDRSINECLDCIDELETNLTGMITGEIDA